MRRLSFVLSFVFVLAGFAFALNAQSAAAAPAPTSLHTAVVYQTTPCNLISVGNVTNGDLSVDGGTCTDTTSVNVDQESTSYSVQQDPPYPASYVRVGHGQCDFYDQYGHYYGTGDCP